MIRRYQDVALRLAARLAGKELDDLDLRVLRDYFTLADEDRGMHPPSVSRDQTLDRGEAETPPKGATAALLPWGVLVCKAQPKVEADPLLLAVMTAFFVWVAYLLWRRS
jgi:hypothetical protein